MSNQIFFTSDQHFGHANIIEYSNRPFETVEEMDEHLIKQWNSVVTGQNTPVYHLGDFSLSNDVEYVKKILRQLNGKITFIRGNHDRTEVIRHCFNTDTDGKLAKVGHAPWVLPIKHEHQKIVLSHFSMRSWDQQHRGTWHLFGHSHNTMPDFGLSFDIGVDAIAARGMGYRPISFAEVKDIMATKMIETADGHTSVQRNQK